jgi:coenzyme F420 hydrogenase subunit beta
MSRSDPFPASRTLSRVERGSLCAGCGACALVAPGAVEMRMAPPGFLRPHQVSAVPPEAEALIRAICPGMGQKVEPAGRQTDVLWGAHMGACVGWSSDPDLRHRASSGGALSALLVYLLRSRTVEGVVQTGIGVPVIATAAVVSHSPSDVARAAGSRYAPSSPLADLGGYLEAGRPHAFVGKPCDVAALRALELHDPRVSVAFPYMLSFFCAGVPSQAGAEALLEALGVRAGELVDFRYRGMGWPGRATATLADGSERSMSYLDSWGGILSHHVQHRCKLCADGTGKAADIVCADAWDVDEEGYPLFEEAAGVSLLLVRTGTGARLLEAARASGALQTAAFDLSRLAGMQPGQTRRRRALAARLAGQALAGRPLPRYRGLGLLAAARQSGFAGFVRNFTGTFLRVIKGHT